MLPIDAQLFVVAIRSNGAREPIAKFMQAVGECDLSDYEWITDAEFDAAFEVFSNEQSKYQGYLTKYNTMYEKIFGDPVSGPPIVFIDREGMLSRVSENMIGIMGKRNDGADEKMINEIERQGVPYYVWDFVKQELTIVQVEDDGKAFVETTYGTVPFPDNMDRSISHYGFDGLVLSMTRALLINAVPKCCEPAWPDLLYNYMGYRTTKNYYHIAVLPTTPGTGLINNDLIRDGVVSRVLWDGTMDVACWIDEICYVDRRNEGGE